MSEPTKRYLYWFREDDFKQARKELEAYGYKFSTTLITPCQVLRSRGKKLLFAPPSVWSRVCVRQGSWYRDSKRNGQTMIMSDHKLPTNFDEFLDAEMSTSDFQPNELPTREQLERVVASEKYRAEKPDEWEDAGVKDAVMFKTLFGITGFWGKGDNMKKHWLGHRANHANFISRDFTAEIDGEEVPYSVTGNDGVCSSCAEFFNVLESDSRKMVRSCPGAITFGGSLRDIYYDVKPTNNPKKD